MAKEKTQQKLNVIYFTIVPLVGGRNGGLLSCRNNLEKISADPGVENFALVAALPNYELETLEYFKSKSIAGRFVSLRPIERSFEELRIASDVSPLTRTWPFPHEFEAHGQSQVDDALQEEIRRLKPDFIVVDYLQSSFYSKKLYKCGVPVVLITLNREAEFFSDQIALGQSIYGRPGSKWAWRRLKLREWLLHWRSKGVVAIGRHDVPKGFLMSGKGFWQAPCLDPVSEGWTYSASRSVHFIGNRGHYPNGLAMEWLASRLSPELQKLDPLIRIRIVGCSPEHAPEHWKQPNIDFLGYGDESLAHQQFRSEDLFIAPIQNNFGAKFKVAEAISYGQPLLATEMAMSGVSYLPWTQPIQLDQPEAAARRIVALVDDPASLKAMSDRILEDAAAYRDSCRTVWGTMLRQMLGRPTDISP